MKLRLSAFLLLFAAIMSTNFNIHAGEQSLSADLIIINANIHTMDTRQPTAQAVAISGNRIVAVGTSNEIKKLAGPQTRVIDAHNQLVRSEEHTSELQSRLHLVCRLLLGKKKKKKQ